MGKVKNGEKPVFGGCKVFEGKCGRTRSCLGLDHLMREERVNAEAGTLVNDLFFSREQAVNYAADLAKRGCVRHQELSGLAKEGYFPERRRRP